MNAAYVRFTIKTGLDEDAGFALESDRFTLLAVFDGMGGMGSRRFSTMNDLTSAFLASHLYAHVLEKDFYYCLERGLFETEFDYAAHLQAVFTKEGQRVKTQYLSREISGVQGSMVRSLPSTAVIALVDKMQNNCQFIWAGDSRGYFLADNGLYQITSDNVKHAVNAFESLYQDMPMTNFLNADAPFVLYKRAIVSTKPGVFLVASDGAFGCLPTPMHFESMLLDALSVCASIDEWLLAVKQALLPLATDDVTIAVQPVGFDSFQQMQLVLGPRTDHIKTTYILPSQNAEGCDGPRTLWLHYHEEMYGVAQ